MQYKVRNFTKIIPSVSDLEISKMFLQKCFVKFINTNYKIP